MTKLLISAFARIESVCVLNENFNEQVLQKGIELQCLINDYFLYISYEFNSLVIDKTLM